MLIRNFADVQAFEAEPLTLRALPRSTYDALAASAGRWSEAKAVSFLDLCRVAGGCDASCKPLSLIGDVQVRGSGMVAYESFVARHEHLD
jgi:hypothetical protein